MRAPHRKPRQTVRDAAARSFLRWIYAHGYPAKRIFCYVAGTVQAPHWRKGTGMTPTSG